MAPVGVGARGRRRVPAVMAAMVWPGGGWMMRSAVRWGRRVAAVALLLDQVRSTSMAPRARRPVNSPSGQSLGRAGRRRREPSWLWRRSSAMAAVAPKLPSIWKMGPELAGWVSKSR